MKFSLMTPHTSINCNAVVVAVFYLLHSPITCSNSFSQIASFCLMPTALYHQLFVWFSSSSIKTVFLKTRYNGIVANGYGILSPNPILNNEDVFQMTLYERTCTSTKVQIFCQVEDLELRRYRKRVYMHFLLYDEKTKFSFPSPFAKSQRF